MVESGEVVAEAAGQASTRGSACSKEGRAAELLDTVARRGDDRGRDYGGGAAVGASAMVRESEGERQGQVRCRRGRGGDMEPIQRPGTRSGKLLVPWRARARRRHLSACSGESRQLTGAGQHSVGPPGGLPGEFLCFLFLFLFLLFLFCVLK